MLTIFNVTKEDEGWYVCVAMNTLGKTTAKGYLTVLECKFVERNKYKTLKIQIAVL